MASQEAKNQVSELFDPSTQADHVSCTATSMDAEALYNEAMYCNGSTGEQNVGCQAFSTNRIEMPRWCSSCSDTTTCADTQTNADDVPCSNIASRMVQKEALAHAQGSYFIS